MFKQMIDVKRQPRTTMKIQVQGTIEEQQASMKQKTTPKCPSILLSDYMKRNKQPLDEGSEQEIEKTDINSENYDGGKLMTIQ